MNLVLLIFKELEIALNSKMKLLVTITICLVLMTMLVQTSEAKYRSEEQAEEVAVNFEKRTCLPNGSACTSLTQCCSQKCKQNTCR